MKAALPLLVLLMMMTACPALCGAFEIKNGYFRVSGDNGVITSLRTDASGGGSYGRNTILAITIGEPVPNPGSVPEITTEGDRCTLRDAQSVRAVKLEQDEANAPERLMPGHTLGQVFDFGPGVLREVRVKLPTWHTSDSSATITLYRLDGNSRRRIASRRLQNIEDNSLAELAVPDEKAGRFEVELSDPEGMVGWWSIGRDVIAGDALADGKPVPAMDRVLHCYGTDVVTGDYEIALAGNRMRVSFTASGGAAAPDSLQMVIPWVRSGYDTTGDRIVFTHFRTNTGIYMPVHQFKRRPHSGVSGNWVMMGGREGSDLKFPDAAIHLSMSEDSMTLHFPGASREIEVLPTSDDLGEHYAQFTLSDKASERILNEFLLSHNFNFGVGTHPDWKDWHTLQLSWTANPQTDWQHLQFLGHNMAPDGYVYCWGADSGWPFPYEDRDGDGVNDIDTRHFTSNPCYILGAWREYCWTREPEYLAKLMPRVRKAMNFMLEVMEGDRGVLTARAPGHEGRDGDIGSNYWDITPFGFKDAFTNAHYYTALEAMAQMEEAALALPDLPPPGPGEAYHTPYYYRRLAEKVRKDFNDTFWLDDKGRYSGCVDIDGVSHDYGFTFVNLPAMAYGLADPLQVRRIYSWMETGITSSGKADTYSRWIFAPRASTFHNPKRTEPQTPLPSWWCRVWAGTGFDEQCQDGGAILYTSFHDILARARYLGADNAWQRLTEILDRYSRPDRLSGGSPLYYGEATQGGPGGSAGSVGVEGEFPESGLVPVSFLYAFLGIDADAQGLKIRPNLPSSLSRAGVRHLRFAGKIYNIMVTNSSVELQCISKGFERTVRATLAPEEVFRFDGD